MEGNVQNNCFTVNSIVFTILMSGNTQVKVRINA